MAYPEQPKIKIKRSLNLSLQKKVKSFLRSCVIDYSIALFLYSSTKQQKELTGTRDEICFRSLRFSHTFPLKEWLHCYQLIKFCIAGEYKSEGMYFYKICLWCNWQHNSLQNYQLRFKSLKICQDRGYFFQERQEMKTPPSL